MLLKTYDTVLGEIFSRIPKEHRKDLRQIESILKHFQNPHKTFPSVHIAGTNGKGQVAAKIAHALYLGGYRAGLFTSPHLFDYRERIQVNGQKIPQEEVCGLHEELNEYLKKVEIELNFFECTFLYACMYFAREKVDIAVIETGMGGKFDTTNVVEPMVSVITSVSFDHMDKLGNTLDEIAEQKAGIIKPKTPVVIGPHAHVAPIFTRAKELQCEQRTLSKKTCFYDTENTLIAKETIDAISKMFPLSQEVVAEGLKFSLPCRFEKKGNVIYDVAHNPDGFARLANALGRQYPYRKFRFVIGMGKGKKHEKCLRYIERKASHIHFVQAKNRDGIDPSTLAKSLELFSSCPYTAEKSVEKGFSHAKKEAAKDELIVVCGSFYIMEDAYA